MCENEGREAIKQDLKLLARGEPMPRKQLEWSKKEAKESIWQSVNEPDTITSMTLKS
jgi:hypothetical protein